MLWISLFVYLTFIIWI